MQYSEETDSKDYSAITRIGKVDKALVINHDLTLMSYYNTSLGGKFLPEFVSTTNQAIKTIKNQKEDDLDLTLIIAEVIDEKSDKDIKQILDAMNEKQKLVLVYNSKEHINKEFENQGNVEYSKNPYSINPH